MAYVDELQIKITTNDTQAAKGIQNIANALGSLNEKMGSFGKGTENLNSVAEAIGKLADSFSDLTANARGLKSINIQIGNIVNGSADIANAANAADNFANSTAGMAQPLKVIASVSKESAKGMSDFASAESMAKTVTSALKTGFDTFSKTLKNVGTHFKNIASKAIGAATSIKLFGNSSKGSKKSAAALLKELLRISKMLKLMVTRMVLRKVIQGVLDGFKNLAQYSSTFDATLSLLWNSFRQLGNSIAAAVSPLLNAFAPAINYIIQLCIKAVNAINQLLSALTGLGTWTRAKTLTDSYAKSLDKAGKSAKELKKTVLGFDELNQLQDNKNSGGGGTSPANMFEEAPIADKWKDWAAKIKEMWKKGDFTELGKEIGKWLLNALESIPWNKIKAKAYKLGKSLATLINGIIETPRLGRTIGKSIAEAINTGVLLAKGFIRNIHWDSLGKFISEAFNGLFENIDWVEIKDTIVAGLRGLAIGIQAAINTFNWDNISTTLINALDTVSAGVKAFFENIKWRDLGQKIGTQISKTLREADWKQVGEAIGDVIQAAIDWVAGVLDKLNIDDVVQAATDMFEGIFDKVDVEELGEIVGKILDGIADFIIGFFKKNHPKIINAVWKFFKGLFKSIDKDRLKIIVQGIFDFALLMGVKAAMSAVRRMLLTKAIELFLGKAISGAAASGAGAAGAGGSATVTAAATTTGTSIAATIGTALLTGLGAVLTGAAIAGTIALAIKDVGKYKEALGVDSFWASLFDRSEEMNKKSQEYAKSKGEANPYLTEADVLTEKLSKVRDALKETSKDVQFMDDRMNGLGASTSRAAEKFLDAHTKASSFGEAVKNAEEKMKTLGTTSETASTSFSKAYRELKNAGTSANTASASFGRVVTAMQNVDTGAKEMERQTSTSFGNVYNTSKLLTSDMPSEFETAKNDTNKALEEMRSALDKVKEGMSEDQWTFDGVIDGLKNTFSSAIDGVKDIWNKFANKANGTYEVGSGSFNIHLPRFAAGGFPEDGLFMANHNEMVGRFSNGRTAVANNEQITNGIAQAVYSAMISAQSSGGGQYINNTIMVDGEVLARTVTKGQEKMNRRYSPTMA